MKTRKTAGIQIIKPNSKAIKFNINSIPVSYLKESAIKIHYSSPTKI